MHRKNINNESDYGGRDDGGEVGGGDEDEDVVDDDDDDDDDDQFTDESGTNYHLCREWDKEQWCSEINHEARPT